MRWFVAFLFEKGERRILALSQDLEGAFYHTEKIVFSSTSTSLFHLYDFSFLHCKAHQSKMFVFLMHTLLLFALVWVSALVH